VGTSIRPPRPIQMLVPLTRFVPRRSLNRSTHRCEAPPATLACFCPKHRVSAAIAILTGPLSFRPWRNRTPRFSAYDCG
jgi:hypothetical protein